MGYGGNHPNFAKYLTIASILLFIDSVETEYVPGPGPSICYIYSGIKYRTESKVTILAHTSQLIVFIHFNLNLMSAQCAHQHDQHDQHASAE